MATIHCSNKLKEFIGLTNIIDYDNPIENIFGNWNSHLFNIGRIKYLIFVNNISYYSVFIEDFRKKDLKDLEAIFIKRLLEQLFFDKIIEISEIQNTIQKYLPIKLTRTNNDKKAIGTMNDFIYHFKVRFDSSNLHFNNLSRMNSLINDIPTGAGRKKGRTYGNPINDMKQLLSNTYK